MLTALPGSGAARLLGSSTLPGSGRDRGGTPRHCGRGDPSCRAGTSDVSSSAVAAWAAQIHSEPVVGGRGEGLALGLPTSLPASSAMMLLGSPGGAALLSVGVSSEGQAIRRTPGLYQSAGGRGGFSAFMAMQSMEEMGNGSCKHSRDNPGHCAGGPGCCAGSAGSSTAHGRTAAMRAVQTHPVSMVEGGGGPALIAWCAGTVGLGSSNNGHSLSSCSSSVPGMACLPPWAFPPGSAISGCFSRLYLLCHLEQAAPMSRDICHLEGLASAAHHICHLGVFRMLVPCGLRHLE